ncbi:DNA-binding protein [Ktedonosporobacter rubrisoli]|uniref:DNA-binding protein n=1 Tax=Ktedonosporobacter rubrisoli TaxID=2509675 RepID=A0A4P6JTS3_KTERU|nr:helix-turn-helix domain-containing protein [Ktedonosporobacter rubrisoli]QBD78682.1 DNA-binding protein [Ktedonosporobacter rubrisoli]
MTDKDVSDLSKFVSVKQAAEMLGISVKRLYKYVEDGRLLAFKPGGRDYLIPKEAVENLELKAAGRPREKTPRWNIYRSGSQLRVLAIDVQIRPGQQGRLEEKLQEIRRTERHIFTGSIARYILEDSTTSDLLSIWLIWKDSELPEPAQQERELAAFRAELDDVLDWQTARYQHKKGLLYT